VWRVTGPQGSLVLFATHQAAARDDVPAAAWVELERADVYVAEADEVPEAAEHDDEHRALYTLPRGSSLQVMLGDDDYMELERRIGHRPTGVRPWVAMLQLTAAAYRFPSPNQNAALLERARGRGIATEFLDTWQEQARYLDAAITPATLKAAIHDYGTIGCVMPNRLAAYRAGDDAVFANEIASAQEPVVARIDRWFARIEGYATSGRHAFVAIGIGQLVGPYGLLAKLSTHGYTVQRL
jgi:uncharacterized protein YbaP (TraB family)